MSDDVQQPEWMKGFTPKTGGRKGWVPGMKSPNPRGRPKGIVDKRSRLLHALRDDGPEIARVVIDAALNGDMQAAALVLNRIAPPLKAKSENVQFELSPDKPLGEQAAQVVNAVAQGDIDPETAKTVLSCLQSVAGIKAVELLEERVLKLEGTQQ